ncbi:hypothetical protein LSCM1_01492 [Leishmania martiniquensis]|uniref:Uncharacterized protein n=1 Tax=Leishmania martiniquensis TaxID=1580590 RepID=A0A836GAQ0_9TRYP|nr:hypothetical protein LSCM1_01492 [Leishmania martiniquensis]
MSSERPRAGLPPRAIFAIVLGSVWVLGIILYIIFYYSRRKRAERRERRQATAQVVQTRGVPYGGPLSPYGPYVGAPPVARGTVVTFQEAPVAVAGPVDASPHIPEGAVNAIVWPPPQQQPPLYPGVVMEQRQEPGSATDSAIVYGTAYYYAQPNGPQTENTEHGKPSEEHRRC